MRARPFGKERSTYVSFVCDPGEYLVPRVGFLISELSEHPMLQEMGDSGRRGACSETAVSQHCGDVVLGRGDIRPIRLDHPPSLGHGVASLVPGSSARLGFRVVCMGRLPSAEPASVCRLFASGGRGIGSRCRKPLL